MAAATTMPISSELAAALLLFAAATVIAAAPASTATSDEDLVSRACTNATRNFCRLKLSKETCVSTLRSDSRSAAARRLSDLTLVALDLVGASAAAADAAVGAAAARSLQYCRLDYDDMARTVAECRRLVQRYQVEGGLKNESDSMHYFGCVNRLRDAAVGCWDQVRGSFGEKEKAAKKKVQKEVYEVVQRASVAKAIQEQMLLDPTTPSNQWMI